MSHPAHVQERNQDATVYVGDLDQQVTEPLLWELMLQAGPVVNVHIPKDKLTGVHSGFGFVEFHSEEDAEYSLKIMNMIKLYGKPIRVNKASQDKKTLDVGANLFIGNLDDEVDEKMLYDTFSAFGVIISTPKIMRGPDGMSRGFAFVGYESFESSDAAIASMNGQFLGGKPITVTYALKKDSKTERHGDAAERILAANNPNSATRGRPHQIFSMAPPPPGAVPTMAPPGMMGGHPGMMGGMPPGMMGGHPGMMGGHPGMMGGHPGMMGGMPPGMMNGMPPGMMGGMPPPGMMGGMPPGMMGNYPQQGQYPPQY